MNTYPEKKRVHLIFKTHLDIGFTDFASHVVRQYLEEYIPNALTVAREFRDRRERFIWTTGSWIIYQFLEKAPTDLRKRMEESILRGEISWHALPFTIHSEITPPELFRSGLSISQELDKRFGVKTIAGKFTDVPGHTREIIPLLAEAGVIFLHIGINPASSPADVPPLFRWKHPSGDEVFINYTSGYGNVTELHDLKDILSFAHKDDNLSPPTVEQVMMEYQRCHQRFPKAIITASTLNDYANALLSQKETLPVVTGELGDTWIHGVASDPLKMAQYRQLCRTLSRWENAALPAKYPEIERMKRTLLLVPEHTWGLDVKTHLSEYTHYRKKDFEHMRKAQDVSTDPSTEGKKQRQNGVQNPFVVDGKKRKQTSQFFHAMESSWMEQRQYIQESIACLHHHTLKKEAIAAVQQVSPPFPARGKTSPLGDTSLGDTSLGEKEKHEFPTWLVGFDHATGAITSLQDHMTGREWCLPGGNLALFQYEIFSAKEYEHFYQSYVINKDNHSLWSLPDFTKPGLDSLVELRHTQFKPNHTEFRVHYSSHGDAEVLAFLTMPEEAVTTYGAPAELCIRYTFPSRKLSLSIELYWKGKSAVRTPEASWFSFSWAPADREGWTMEKLGGHVSPFDVVQGGNKALHALMDGIVYQDDTHVLRFKTLDAPVISPGRPRILEFDREDPNLAEGFHINLHNNLWGTNFPMWYNDDGYFRFQLNIEERL